MVRVDIDFTTVVQVLLGGLATGSTYALVGLGLVLILTTTAVANFAHGEIGLLATFVSYSVVTGLGLSGVWGATVAILTGVGTAALCGVAVGAALVRPAAQQSLISVAVLTLGLFFLFHAVTVQIWGPNIKQFPSILGTGVLQFAGAALAVERIGVLLVAFVAAIGLAAWLRLTRMGIASRAIVENPLGATLTGLPTERLKILMWAIGTGLAGLAGVLIAPTAYLSPNMMLTVLVYGFAAATLGGLTSLSGAFVGGLILGVIQSVTSVFVSGELAGAVGLIVIVVVLMVRPAGLLGRIYVEKV